MELNLEAIKDDLIVLLNSVAIIAKEGYYSNDKEISTKTDERDYLTKYDIKINRVIVEHLEKSYPEITIISEEEDTIEKNSEYSFHIDPIDGTSNFIRNIPTFLNGIGLSKNGEVVLCVTNNPILEEMFWAIKSVGAYKNDKKIVVSKRDLITADVELDSKEWNLVSKFYDYLNKDTPRIRADKSMHYQFSGIACGRFEAMVSSISSSWDLCHYLLITEAGGKVTNFGGEEFSLKDTANGIIASNGLVHEELLKIAKQ